MERRWTIHLQLNKLHLDFRHVTLFYIFSLTMHCPPYSCEMFVTLEMHSFINHGPPKMRSGGDSYSAVFFVHFFI